MQKYIGTAIKKDVNNPAPAGETPAKNVDVRVVVTSTGALANIYSDNGITPINQDNYKTDDNGNHEFYAENGRYTVRYLLASGVVEYTDISLFDINDYAPSGGGEANTASNKGSGAGLAMPKSGVDLPFKSIIATGGASITEQAETITIDVSSAGGDMLKSTYDPTNQNKDVFANDAIYNTQAGTSYTLLPADRGKTVRMNNASANTVSIAANATQNIPANSVIIVGQLGAGSTKIQAVAGVSLNGVDGGSVTISGRFKSAVLDQYAVNSWWCEGAI